MPRLAAWNILRSGSSTPLRLVDRYSSELPERDVALLRRLIGVEVRRRGTLRAVVRHLAKRNIKPDIAAHLHIGLVQILFLDRVPPHAAVSETLGAVERSVGQSKVHLVNAILRTALRMTREGHLGDPRHDVVGRELHFADPVFRDRNEHPFLWAEDALSVPASMFKRWSKRHGTERAQALALNALEEPELCLRGVRLDRDGAVAALAAEGLAARAGHHPRSLRLDSSSTGALLASAPFRAGKLVVQGEAALAAAELLGAQADERILDLCAAPGGKTMVLLEAGARVTAVDSNEERLAKVTESAGRLGLQENLTSVVADGTGDWSVGGQGEAPFDAALVDAPCSNTGVLAGRPGARWRFGPAKLKELGQLQSKLLEAAAARVRPGGRLVWSTCSIEPEEGPQLLRRFLESHPDWNLVESHESLPDGAATSFVDGGHRSLLRRE